MEQKSRKIVRDEDVMGGEPRVEGTRVTVLQISDSVKGRGLEAETVAERHGIAVADVYRALTYYHENPDVIEEVLDERERAEERAVEGGAVRSSDLTKE